MKLSIMFAMSIAALTGGCTTVNISAPVASSDLQKNDAGDIIEPSSDNPASDGPNNGPNAADPKDSSSTSDAGALSHDAALAHDSAVNDASTVKGDASNDSAAPVPSNCSNDCSNCQVAYKYCNPNGQTGTTCETSWQHCVAPINTGACGNAGFTCSKL